MNTQAENHFVAGVRIGHLAHPNKTKPL